MVTRTLCYQKSLDKKSVQGNPIKSMTRTIKSDGRIKAD